MESEATGPSATAAPRGWLCQPVLALLMGSPGVARAITGFLILQFGLTAAGLPAVPCPIATFTPTHCPGCGLSRAIGALVRGDLPASLHFHALAFPFLVGGLLIAAAAVLPRGARERLVSRVQRVELRTCVTGLVLVGTIAYWLFRLASGHGHIDALG